MQEIKDSKALRGPKSVRLVFTRGLFGTQETSRSGKQSSREKAKALSGVNRQSSGNQEPLIALYAATLDRQNKYEAAQRKGNTLTEYSRRGLLVGELISLQFQLL